MSSWSYNSTNQQEKNEYDWGLQQGGGYGGGGQCGGFNEGVLGAAQQPIPVVVDGMTTQPSVGRFTENEREGNVTMFARKLATPVMAPALTNALLSYNSSSQSGSTSSSGGGIVNRRAAAPLGAEGKMNKKEKERK